MDIRGSITINGDLGSGKSTVATEIATRVGMPRIAMGDIHRQIAEERGMTALELNRHSEVDLDIDARIDGIQQQIAALGDSVIVDSRLGWYFFGGAFKVYLVTDPVVAAKRVVSRPASTVESYGSVDEAVVGLRDRSESERARFISRYGIDKSRLRNYNFVCDTTRIQPNEAAARIIEECNRNHRRETSLLLDPARLYPTDSIRQLRGLWDAEGKTFIRQVAIFGLDALDPIEVGYDGLSFFIVNGHRRVSAALQAGLTLVRAELVADIEELVVGGLNSHRFFTESVSLAVFYDWVEAHKLSLSMPPHLLQATVD